MKIILHNGYAESKFIYKIHTNKLYVHPIILIKYLPNNIITKYSNILSLTYKKRKNAENNIKKNNQI